MKFAQGVFQPKNMAKYIGKALPRFRSSWEAHFFRFLDEHAGVIQWSSESLEIPYRHPLTGKPARYIPDVLMMYRDRDNNVKVELIEIKPRSQTSLQEARSVYDKAQAIVNQAKWDAARAFCRQQGIMFRIMSEGDLFRNAKIATPKPKKRVTPRVIKAKR